mgnify:CR=1 FL=1
MRERLRKETGFSSAELCAHDMLVSTEGSSMRGVSIECELGAVVGVHESNDSAGKTV